VASEGLGALTLPAQFLETRVNDRKIVGSSRASALAAQLFDARTDHRKIIGRAGSRHFLSALGRASDTHLTGEIAISDYI
jgi:hypothetical protein